MKIHKQNIITRRSITVSKRVKLWKQEKHPFCSRQSFRLHVYTHISTNTFVLLAIKNMKISIISTYDEYQAKYTSYIHNTPILHYTPIYIHIVYTLLLFLLPFTPIISIYVSACAYIKTHPTPHHHSTHTKTLCNTIPSTQ